MGTKSPVAAGLLNVGPGLGNVYLAIGTGEKAQIWGFVGNLLFWPISVVWGVPQAVIDTPVINKKQTVNFYYAGPGKSKLEELRRQKSGTRR